MDNLHDFFSKEFYKMIKILKLKLWAKPWIVIFQLAGSQYWSVCFGSVLLLNFYVSSVADGGQLTDCKLVCYTVKIGVP